MSTLVIVVSIEILGLALVLLYVRARLNKALDVDSLVESLRKEVRGLTIELNETADRNISLVEDRMQALHELLVEADGRLGVMHAELRKRDGEVEAYAKLGRPRPQAPGPSRPAGAAPGPLPQETTQAAEAAESQPPGQAFQRPRSGEAQAVSLPLRGPGRPEAIKLELGGTLPKGGPEFLTRESVIPPKTTREEALELYAKGFSADLIAARLGSTVAEIDLLISLEEEKRGGGRP